MRHVQCQVLASKDYGTFDGDFLVAWGARYTPIMRYEPDQWWRWISSCALTLPPSLPSSFLALPSCAERRVFAVYVHLNRGHIVGNLLFYVPVAGLLEWRFGPLRFLFVLVVTVIGGNMFSSLLEEECFFYAGACSSALPPCVSHPCTAHDHE